MAADVALRAGCRAVISTDADLGVTEPLGAGLWPVRSGVYQWLKRPPALAQDDTPMIDVVRHVLAQIPGPEDEIVLLVQPTQPLREPKHLQAAIDLLRETVAASVVSVKALAPARWIAITNSLGQLFPWSDRICGLEDMPARRQDQEVAYIRDGTVYACYRRTVRLYENLYGPDCRALIIPAEETCALDTLADWAEAERRLRERRCLI
jgi:CMP-N-acetylneuraminic acid synthetase